MIVEVMRATKTPDGLSSLAGVLAVLAGQIDPKLSAEGAEKIVEAMRATNEPFQLRSLASGLAVLAGKIDPKLAAEGAEEIVEAMRDTTHLSPLSTLAAGLAGLAGKIDPTLSDEVAEKIVEAMRATTNVDRLHSLAGGLAGLAGMINAKIVAPLAEKIVEAMRATNEPSQVGYFAGVLAGLAGKIDPKLSAKVAEKIVEAMRTTNNPSHLSSLARSLFELRQVQSVDRPQIVVNLLKQPLAVMRIQSNSRETKYPRTWTGCLLAYLGHGLRKEPFPDLQSFLVWAKAHPEVDLDLESPPELRMAISPTAAPGRRLLGGPMPMIRIPSPAMADGRRYRRVFEEAAVDPSYLGGKNATVTVRHWRRPELRDEASDESGARRARNFPSAVVERHQ